MKDMNEAETTPIKDTLREAIEAADGMQVAEIPIRSGDVTPSLITTGG